MRKNPWIYYGKKLLIFVVSILLLSVIVFYIARLAPGDPLVSYYGDRAEKNWGFMNPLPYSTANGWNVQCMGILEFPISIKWM